MNTGEIVIAVVVPALFYGVSRLMWRGGGYRGSHRLATWIGVVGLFLTVVIGGLEH